MAKRKTNQDTSIVPSAEMLTYNLKLALPGRASSRHTSRAYFRWIDRYLTDVAALSPVQGKAREDRMSALPVEMLRKSLSAPQLRTWLGTLVREGHGKQGINQARAAIVTLASLLSEAGWVDDYTSMGMRNVRPPSAEDGQRPGRWLSPDEVKMLMVASREMGVTASQRLRNDVVTTILCTMALRREELANARWGDFTIQNNRPVLRVHGKGKKAAYVDVPRPVFLSLDRWRHFIAPDTPRPPDNSPLVRRLWRNGHVSKYPLTVEGIWLIVRQSAEYANLGTVAPHDLRRSVAGALQQSGVPIDTISRLLRHSNVAVTERYLSRLPQRNEGALLMSSVLGLEDDEDPFSSDMFG